MKEFKSKTNISDYVIPMKVKRDQSFPYLKAWRFYLLNERIQIKNEYSWLSNPYKTKERYSLSCIWKAGVHF